MNPNIFECRCSVCGGGGMATMGDMASEWYGGTLAHSDPDVCRQILANRRSDMDKEQKRLNEKQQKENIRNSEYAASMEDRKFVDVDDEVMFERFEEANKEDNEKHY